MRAIVASIEAEFRRYKILGERAMEQLSEEELAHSASGGANSIATIAWHISGNLKSRFSDFLSSDGEKPWRHRDSEFEPRSVTRSELLQKWEDGWDTLFAETRSLTDQQLGESVVIRGQPLTVHEALARSLAHTSYHVGQIVYIAKSCRGSAWEFLSIPPGSSAEYSLHPTMEKQPPKGDS